ncbi:DUF7715 family protein [Saccharopolyspora erythraea]|uniref:DUF7715 family protein n=1 Tax=Saccharopolyspora erythraea TaxID=1836 RepID=UPI001179EF6C|nr:hypothetical protein [Saccharopolyspora erythraea]QRK88013.1 hypothetical protein JQX30_25185 [Saccharopolyspora erythraea]
MPTFTVLVATARAQGNRDNDVHHTAEGELVDFAPTCDLDLNHPDDRCGDSRAFQGLDSGKATTTTVVAERELTFQQYRDAFYAQALLRARHRIQRS